MKMLNKKLTITLLLGAALAPLAVVALAGCTSSEAPAPANETVVTPPAGSKAGEETKKKADGQ